MEDKCFNALYMESTTAMKKRFIHKLFSSVKPLYMYEQFLRTTYESRFITCQSFTKTMFLLPWQPMFFRIFPSYTFSLIYSTNAVNVIVKIGFLTMA